MSKTERCTAIILDRMAYQEHDRIYSLLTLERGFVRARARGASKPLAKVRPHLEGFGVVDVMLVQGKNGFLLASAECIEPIRITGVEAHLVAAAARRVLARVLREGDRDEELFAELVAFLRDLAEERMHIANTLALREMHFFWRVLEVLGYNGDSTACNLCRKPLAGEARFVPLAGAFFCAECARRNGVLVSGEMRDFLGAPHEHRAAERLDAREFASALGEHFTHRLDVRYPGLQGGAN